MKAFLSKLQASVEQLQMVPSVYRMLSSIIIAFKEATNEFRTLSFFFYLGNQLYLLNISSHLRLTFFQIETRVAQVNQFFQLNL